MRVGHNVVIAISISLALAMGHLGYENTQRALAQGATSAINDKFATTVLRGDARSDWPLSARP